MNPVDALLKPEVPHELYHYTSFGGLLGILKSRSIWATNIHYLNDEQEFAYGVSIVKEEIAERAAASPPPDDAELLRHLAHHLDSMTRTNVFVASFSEVDDLLSQWRGYCPNGKGASIGFYSEDLERAARFHHFQLMRVAYERHVARAVAASLVDSALRMRDVSRNYTLDGIAEFFAWHLSSIAPALKHETFSEEREWRIVGIPPLGHHPQLRVREASGRLVPYFEFELSEKGQHLRVGRVRVGPASDRQRALDGVCDTLDICRVQFQSVLPSSIPYRE